MKNNKYVSKQTNRESRAQKKDDLTELIANLSARLNGKDNVLSPSEILQICDEFSSIFQVKKEAINDCDVMDIKINAEPDDEDRIFASCTVLHQNFRRGLSFINHKGQLFYLRKGMKKFFDISHANMLEKLKNPTIEDTLMQYTFQSVLNALNDKQTITVIIQQSQLLVYEKANGENAQISYFQPLDSWVISSKNTSLLCKEADDLKKYSEQRYHLACQIAQEWFRLIKNTDLAQLKLVLSQFTLVGEYCGNPQYQHLVRYTDIELKFFSLVDKQGTQTCTNMEHFNKLIQQENFQSVKCREKITVDTIDQLQEVLHNLNVSIKNKNIEEEGEGVVIYFLNQNYECLSLAKLKTLDYKIHRQIRESLRDCIQQKGNPVKAYQNLQNNLKVDEGQKKQYLDYAAKLLQEAQKFMKCQQEQNVKQIQQLIYRLIDKQYLTIKSLVLSGSKQNVFQFLIMEQNNKEDQMQ